MDGNATHFYDTGFCLGMTIDGVVDLGSGDEIVVEDEMVECGMVVEEMVVGGCDIT